MNHLNKFMLTVVAASLLSFSAHAVVVNVDGVVWDTDAQGGTDPDFTARAVFDQFFTDTNGTGATFFNPSLVGIGDTLSGVGEIGSFNGVSVDPSSALGGGAGSFCPGCELTFSFGGFVIDGPNSFNSDNAFFNFYVDNSPDFDVSTNPLLIANATDGSASNPWLTLSVATHQFVPTDNFVGGFLGTQLEVTGGTAANFFNTNTINNFQFDLTSTASAQFGLVDIDGDGNANEWVAASTGEFRGDTTPPTIVPEPGSLALMAIGILGLFGAARRRKGL